MAEIDGAVNEDSVRIFGTVITRVKKRTHYEDLSHVTRRAKECRVSLETTHENRGAGRDGRRYVRLRRPVGG